MEKKTKVLLVDDEADFTEVVSLWLVSKGYSVDVAGDGMTAIEMIKEKKPDIVFLDLNMPVMDGIQTLQRIRKFSKKLPIIIVTVAHEDEERFFKAQKLGTSGFFPKTGSLERLVELIELTLRRLKTLKQK